MKFLSWKTGNRLTETQVEWTRQVQMAHPIAVAVMHPDWRGIRRAMQAHFRYYWLQDDTLTSGEANALARMIVESGCTKVVLGGFPLSYAHFVRSLKEISPGSEIYITWHGSFLQMVEDYEWKAFRQAYHLCEERMVNKLVFVKAGMSETIAKTGVPAAFMMNFIPQIPDGPSIPQPGGPHISLWSLGLVWRKNPMAMLAALSMIPDVKVHLPSHHRQAIELAQLLGVQVIIRNQLVPQEHIFRAMAEMDLNLYVTLSECTPVTPLESLASGSPCLIGPNSHLFEDSPYLFSRLVVPYPDRAEIIAEYIHNALQERTAIIQAYMAYAPEYNARARQSVIDFLEAANDAII